MKKSNLLISCLSLLFFLSWNILNGQESPVPCLNSGPLEDFQNGTFDANSTTEVCSPNSSVTLPGISAAFNNNCVSPWASAHGNPDLRSGILNSNGLEAITPVVGNYFAVAGAKHRSERPCTNEAFFQDYEFTPGRTYQLSFQHATGCPSCNEVPIMNVQIVLTSGLENVGNTAAGLINCDNLALTNPTIIYEENNFSSGVWQEQTNISFTPESGQNQIVFIPTVNESFNSFTSYWAVDAVELSECSSPISECDEATDNTIFEVVQVGTSSINAAVKYSNDPCTPLSLTWNYGDGTGTQTASNLGQFKTFQHTYEFCGTYEFCVWIDMSCPDGEECIIEICETVVIDNEKCVEPPDCFEVAGDTYFGVIMAGGSGVNAAVLFSTEPCKAQSITWDFGDGTQLETRNNVGASDLNSHVYQFCGEYELCVFIESECPDGEECIIELCETIIIEEDCEVSDCDLAAENTIFEVKPRGGSGIDAVVIYSRGLCTATDITWDYGDGTDPVTMNSNNFWNNTSYSYEYCGVYNFCVTIESVCNEGEICTIELCETVVINENCKDRDNTKRSDSISDGYNKTLKSAKLTNAPNPFSQQTKISYYLENQQEVSLTIHDLQGKIVQQLANQELQDSGNHSFELNTSDFAAGTYICVLKSAENVETLKLIKLQ